MLLRFVLSLSLVGAPASAAAGEDLLYPVDVAVDAKGAIFVADHEAHALLRATDEGYEVVARGDGRPRTPLYGIRHIAARNGGWVASDPATMKLYAITSSGEVTALADDDRFVTPWGVAVEASGDVLAVDRVTHRLRRLRADGTAEDVAEVRAPRAVLVDDEGGIIVLTDEALVRVDDGQAKPVHGEAPFEFPHDAVLHPDGGFYVSDGYAKTIWRVRPDGATEPFVQGDPLRSPQGLAIEKNGDLLVADAHARAIFRITPKGELTQLARRAP